MNIDTLKDTIANLSDEDTKKISEIAGVLGGSLVARYILKRRGATPVEIYVYAALLTHMTLLQNKLDKLVKAAENPVMIVNNRFQPEGDR